MIRSEDEVREIVKHASEEFWKKVAEMCPDIKTGDFDPISQCIWEDACIDAVDTWILQNQVCVEIPEEPKPEVKYYTDGICNMCGEPQTVYIIDGRTLSGQWATMCTSCHEKHGVGLGTGKGQKYKSKTLDGKNFVKIEG